MSNDQFQDFEAFEYETDTRDDSYRKKSRPKAGKTQTPAHARRRAKSPQSVNGIHRRRRRKVAW